MGWMDSVPIFHDNITFILQAEIPHATIPYINDIDHPNTTQTLEYTKDKYNAKIRK
jgi:hypothetical protein